MKKRRLLAGILALAMTVTSISFNAFADEGEEPVVISEEAVSGAAVEAVSDSSSDEVEVGSASEAVNADMDLDTSFPVTAGDWQATVYGDVGNNNIINGESFKIEATSDNSVDMAVSNNRGKIAASSEGLAFYYQQISADEDFTLSATATVNSFTKNNQVAFGLRMADKMIDFGKTVNDDGLTAADYGSSIVVGGFRLGNGALDGIGYYRADDGTKVDASNTAEAAVPFPNDAAKLVGSGEALEAGSEINLKMEYNAAAGVVTLTQGSKSVTLTIAELGKEQEKTVSFTDDMYVGLMAARSVDISYSNIKLSVGQQVFESGSWITGYSYAGAVGGLIAEAALKDDGEPDTVRMYADGTNKGKVNATNDEEYIYYVNEVEEDANFRLTADAVVNSYGDTKNNQTAFGLVFRSDIDMTMDADTSVVKPYTAGYTDKSTGVDIKYEGASGNRNTPSLMLSVNNEGKYTGSEGLSVTWAGAELRYMQKGDTSASHNDFAHFTPEVGEKITLSIAKSGTAYSFSATDKDGNKYTAALKDPNVFSGKIYPGLFMARNVDVTFSNIDLYIDNRVVESIEVTTPPTQTEYYVGESFNPTGMVVTATYDDGSQEVIDDYIAALDTSSTGDKEVSILKGAASASTPVHVRKKNVTDITLTYEPLINRYYEYQLFTTDGIAGTIFFEDGTSEELSADNVKYIVDGNAIDASKYWRASEAGKKTVYVSYADTDTISANDVKASYGITVLSYVLTDIEVKSAPLKKQYAVGEDLNEDGLAIYGIYSDGTNLYYEVFDRDAYTISGFNTSTAGSYEATVTLNSVGMNCTFPYSVDPVVVLKTEISHYPRTTYPTGTSIDEIDETIRSQMIITKTMSNEEEIDLSYAAGEYTYDISAVDPSVNGTYPVSVVCADPTLPSFDFDITIWNDTTYKWRTTIFGATSQKSKYELTNVDENGLAEEVYLWSDDGNGKVTNSGHDGIVYYFTKVDANNNFTISGDVEVKTFLQKGTNAGRYGQEAFGIMARDVIPMKPVDGYSADSTTYEGLGTSVVVKNENAKFDSEGMPVVNNTGTDFYSNVVIAGGFATSSYPSTFLTASNIQKANGNRILMWLRTGVEAWDGTQVGSLKNLEFQLYDGSEFGDYMTTDAQLATGECFYPKPGDKYRITLTRLNSGYYEECTILEVGPGNEAYADRVVGKTFTYAYDWAADNMDADPLVIQNDETIWVGFFAARWASINVTNINVYESSTETDLNKASATDTVETPSVTIVSNLYTTTPDYNLILKAGNSSGGTAVIKLNDEVVDNGLWLTKKSTSVPITLEPNKEYDLTICYTPSTNDTLTSYDTITYREKIYCLTNVDVEGDTIYVAPEEGKGECYSHPGVYGSFAGEGTIESPLSLDAAIAVVNAGQKIIMLDGIYYRDETIKMTSTNYGLRDSYKYLCAETTRAEANSTEEEDGVIIDMQRSREGLSVQGDYWWVKGLTIRNSAVNSQGGGVSGSYNIIEDCAFEDSGSTGFQISGSAADSFDLWPSNNLIINCESFNSCSASAGSADGFGCKLTVGNGNMFKGCVSHNNDDDGWDLYTKTSSGPIGAVILEDCVSYDCSFYLITENNVGGINMTDARKTTLFSTLNPKNYKVGDRVLVQSGAASGNGFKLGGESIYVQHYIKDSVAFGNKAKGIDSNSNPAMKVRNCVSYNNGIWKNAVDGGAAWTVESKTPGTASNYGLYSGVTDKVFNYNLDGAISVAAQTYDNIATYSSYEDGTNQASIYTDGVLDEAKTAETLEALADTANSTNERKKPILTLHKTTDAVPIESATNYLVKDRTAASSTTWGTDRSGKAIKGYAGYNSEGEEVTPDWFVSLNESDAVNANGFISQNADGTYNLNGFCELTDEHQYTYAASDVPVYNYAYNVYYGLAGSDEPVVEPTTEAETPVTPVTPGRSGGGGGGSSSGNGKGTAVAATNADTTAKDDTTGETGSTGESAPVPASSNAFEDIASKAWAVDAINTLAKAGIISGVTSTTFAPDASMTRGDFCILITKLMGLEAAGEAAYDDVDPAAYYAGAVAAATEAGIAQGYDDGTFKPTKAISRQEMFVLIAKAYASTGMDITTDVAVLDKFGDSADVADWAAPYAAFLVENGNVNGNGGMLNPKADITRAETAVILYGFYKDVVEVTEVDEKVEELIEALEGEEEAEEAAEEVSEEETEAAEAEELAEGEEAEAEEATEEEAEAEAETEAAETAEAETAEA